MGQILATGICKKFAKSKNYYYICSELKNSEHFYFKKQKYEKIIIYLTAVIIWLC